MLYKLVVHQKTGDTTKRTVLRWYKTVHHAQRALRAHGWDAPPGVRYEVWFANMVVGECYRRYFDWQDNGIPF